MYFSTNVVLLVLPTSMSNQLSTKLAIACLGLLKLLKCRVRLCICIKCVPEYVEIETKLLYCQADP